jgi:cell division protein FtsB
MSQNLKLEDKHDTLAKLEEKSNKCFKEIEKLKKQKII